MCGGNWYIRGKKENKTEETNIFGRKEEKWTTEIWKYDHKDKWSREKRIIFVPFFLRMRTKCKEIKRVVTVER